MAFFLVYICIGFWVYIKYIDKLSRRTAENERLADTIEKIHEESPDKGYRRLNDDLRHDHGIHVNDKRILIICRARYILL